MPMRGRSSELESQRGEPYGRGAETYVKVAGRWVYLYRAIDQYGHVIGMLVSPKRGSGGHLPVLHPRP